ncbi:unnamed protein product, partial [Nesidiocoris tenuis]
ATVQEHVDVWYQDDGPLSKTLCEDIQQNNEEQPVVNDPCCACDEAKYELMSRNVVCSRRNKVEMGNLTIRLRFRTQRATRKPQRALVRGNCARDHINKYFSSPRTGCLELGVSFEGLWSRHTHPKDFPESSTTRFSDVIGASHTTEYRFWEYGGRASEGLKQVAELGSTRRLETELKLKVFF